MVSGCILFAEEFDVDKCWIYENIYIRNQIPNVNNVFWDEVISDALVRKEVKVPIYKFLVLSDILTEKGELMTMQELKDKGCDCNNLDYVTPRRNLMNVHANLRK